MNRQPLKIFETEDKAVLFAPKDRLEVRIFKFLLLGARLPRSLACIKEFVTSKLTTTNSCFDLLSASTALITETIILNMDQNEEQHTLVRRETNLNFQQQGTIDWTRLAKSIIELSVDFLMRLSRGGVEPLTVVTARAVVSELKLSYVGEERVQNAVQNLKAFSSFQNILWFGFGVKHLVRLLAETREGLNCIAICSALLEVYSTTDTARIWRELATLRGAPRELTPSLRQLVALVDVCGGVLASTDFGTILHSIARCLVPAEVSSSHPRADPVAIAKALNALAAVSNGSPEYVQFSGGSDCALLAAICQWLLDIPVEVRDTEGGILFRSSYQRFSEPKVLIVFRSDNTISYGIARRIFTVPNRNELFRQSEAGQAISSGRVSWDGILSNTFGRAFEELCKESPTEVFFGALSSAARIFTAVVSEERTRPESTRAAYAEARKDWVYLNSAAHGKGFAATIRKFLPEIAQRKGFNKTMETSLASDLGAAVMGFDSSMRAIQKSCPCELCTSSASHNATNRDIAGGIFCQSILVEAITELVRILSSTTFLEDLRPTQAGVEEIYWSRWRVHRRQRSNCPAIEALLTYGGDNSIAQATILFTGRRTTSESLSAVASTGLCFVMDILIGRPTDWEQCSLVRIIPGRITWCENTYDRLADIDERATPFDDPPDQRMAFAEDIQVTLGQWQSRQPSPTNLQSDMIVVEHGDERLFLSLNVGFRIKTTSAHLEIGPSHFIKRLQEALVAKDCKGRECGDSSSVNVVPIHSDRLFTSREIRSSYKASDNTVLITSIQNISVQAIPLTRDHYCIFEGQNIKRGYHVKPVLQGNSCLYCLIRVAQTRWEDSLDTIPLCIVTKT